MRSDQNIIDTRQLRALRRQANIPQQSLAVVIGRSQGFISSVERGFAKLTPDEERAVARVLGIDTGRPKDGKR